MQLLKRSHTAERILRPSGFPWAKDNNHVAFYIPLSFLAAVAVQLVLFLQTWCLLFCFCIKKENNLWWQISVVAHSIEFQYNGHLCLRVEIYLKSVWKVFIFLRNSFGGHMCVHSCEVNTKLLQCGPTLGMSVGLHSATRSWETSLPRRSSCPWIFTCESRGHSRTATCHSSRVSHKTGILCDPYAPCRLGLMNNNPIHSGAGQQGTEMPTEGSSVNGDMESKYRTALLFHLPSGITFFGHVPP